MSKVNWGVAVSPTSSFRNVLYLKVNGRRRLQLVLNQGEYISENEIWLALVDEKADLSRAEIDEAAAAYRVYSIPPTN